MPTIDIPDKICPHCGGTKWYVHGNRYWCSVRRNDKYNVRYKNRDKELHNEKRRARPCYLRGLEKRKEKRKEYRESHPLVKKIPLTAAEKSANYHTKRKNDPLYKEKNRRRAADWLLINKDKMMVSDRYITHRLGKTATPEQKQMYLMYLKASRKLKQLQK